MNRCSKADESHEEDQGEDKPCNMNRKRQSYCLGPSNIQPVQVKEGVENKRVCLRRQSARRKAQEPETTEDTFVVDDSKFLASSTSDDKVLECGPSNIKPFEAKEGIDNTRACLRRQSARFKAQEPETNKDVFEVDELRFLVSSTSNDQVPDSGQLSSDDSSIKSEHKEGNTTVSSRTEAQELRRVSAGRPLRRAVKKVQSYKEMKLNVKMRIQE
ncbi:SHUGOSHIN 1-like [Hibiscus syriacus]|uniref:SHUGOSHIN 1-like n=1 Tax=Hibiscus syriacus TaxID=106335 RepID=UPI001921A20A|nr:SHUGOSHIN 1-like [Hibiscus syriacus]